MAQLWHSVFVLADALQATRTQHRVVCTSGGFDPLHCGHVRCLCDSARYGSLVVIVNGDGFLQRKKGYVFMPLAERMEIVAAIRGVAHVVGWDDGSHFVDGAIKTIRPHIFTKGGDRSTPQAMAQTELEACKMVGCKILYGVGGISKVQSSSWLVKGHR